MAKLDPLSKVGIVLVIVVALVGGLGVWWWSQQPAQTNGGGPTPSSSAASSTPTPTCDLGTDPCTPDVAAEQAETRKLQAEAERVARASYAERVRLTKAGGANEPSEELKRYAADSYLELVMPGLQDQKKRGYTLKGEPHLTLKHAPGQTRMDSDPRLTLHYCEDNSGTRLSESGTELQGKSGKGSLFLSVIDGQTKVVDSTVSVVDSCE